MPHNPPSSRPFPLTRLHLSINTRSTNRIQDQLLHSLHANQANWPTLIQNHALNLLRSGEVTTFPALLRRVLDDVRQDTLNPSSTTSPSTSKTNGTTAGGAEKNKKTNGATSTPTPAAGAAADPNTPPNLAIPAAVIEDAIKVTRESLEAVCDVVDETSGS